MVKKMIYDVKLLQGIWKDRGNKLEHDVEWFGQERRVH
jgi:hypothetical protein